MNKILNFLLLFLIIGGIGYSIYDGRWVIAVGISVAGYMAWPKVKDVIIEMASMHTNRSLCFRSDLVYYKFITF